MAHCEACWVESGFSAQYETGGKWDPSFKRAHASGGYRKEACQQCGKFAEVA